MKLTITYNTEPLVTSGKLEPMDYTETKRRELFIDDKPVPKALADIIMLGLDVATEQYISMIDALREKTEGL